MKCVEIQEAGEIGFVGRCAFDYCLCVLGPGLPSRSKTYWLTKKVGMKMAEMRIILPRDIAVVCILRRCVYGLMSLRCRMGWCHIVTRSKD